MIKILTAQQTKELDTYTILHEPVSSIDLMERACNAFVQWFTANVQPDQHIVVVCGTGNNGGDGLGVARILNAFGYNIKVFIIQGSVKESPDFKINLERLTNIISCQTINADTDLNENTFEHCDVIIDAIFGSGISRPVEGIYAKVIRSMNSADTVRIAIDIPSGLMADKPSSGEIVKAHHTIAFQSPKLAFLFPSSFQYVGEWVTVDIGLDKNFIQNTPSQFFFTTEKAIRRLIKPRSKFDHKGTYGHALLVAGSYSKTGAAVLAAKAALRIGTGLLTVHSSKSSREILQTTVPEAMFSSDENDLVISEVPISDNYNVYGIGPGIGQSKETIKALIDFLKKAEKPVVLDADALNIISANSALLHTIPENSILTPHPKEFQRLVGEWKNDFDRMEKQIQLARELKSIIVLKGANTSIASADGNVYFNSTGNPGMATGGTGDVLTGMITGLVAQGYKSLDAAILGVYLHGLAGDLAVLEKGMHALIASDLVEFLPQAFKKILR